MELLYSILALIALLITVFWLWMLLSCITKEEGIYRTFWMFVAIVPIIGSLLYYLRRQQRKRMEEG